MTLAHRDNTSMSSRVEGRDGLVLVNDQEVADWGGTNWDAGPGL
jgi:hypothetical protein